jgi:hypothetical protein
MVKLKILLMDILTDRFGDAVGLSIYAIIAAVQCAALLWLFG